MRATTPTPMRDPGDRVLPLVLAAADQRRTTGRRRRAPRRASRASRTGASLLRSRDSCDVAERDPQRDGQDRHVDEERDAPADRVDQQAADERAERGSAPTSPTAQMPNARPRSGPAKRLRDDRQRAGHEQRAGRALQQPEHDRATSSVGARPHSAGGDGEAGQADGVDPPPAVVVRQRAGQDQQRGEHRQVAADDVGLALEDADQRWPAARGRSAAGRR